MSVKRINSITFDIILVAFLCVVVILPTTGFASVAIIRHLLQADQVMQSKQTLDFNQQLLRFQLNRARISLETFAEDPIFRQAIALRSNRELIGEVNGRLDGAVGLIKFLETVALQTPDCAVIAVSGDEVDQVSTNLLQSDFCRGTGREEGAYISGQFISTTTFRPVMVMSVPILTASREEIGIVSAVIDVLDMGTYLRSLQQEGQHTVVLDRNNSVLIDTRVSGSEQGGIAVHDSVIGQAIDSVVRDGGNNGIFNTKANGAGIAVAYDRYDSDPGKLTIVNVESQSLANLLERQIVLILFGAGISMVCALALALWVTVRLSTRRLNQITDTIQHIAGGAEEERILDRISASDDEVGTLGRSFNQMIDRIHESRVLLQEAKAKSDAILLGIGDGVVAIGADKKIILFNRAAERISDRDATDVLGKTYRSVLRFVTEKDQKPDDSFIRKALDGKMAVMPDGMSLTRPDGSLVPVADSSAPILAEDGTVAGAVIVFRDVSHERELDRIKTEFVSVASHQLRTPLTAIRWYLEDLQSEEIGPLVEEQKSNVNQAVESTNRMINLVNDMLNVSRLESGRLSIVPKPTDIAEILRGVVQENTGTASSGGCTILLHLPEEVLPELSVDPVLIRQVAMNLLSNAVKYASPETGRPQVDVTLSKDGKHYYRITIQDNGMGIGAEDKGRIFERFFRANNAVKCQAEGSGLGLYIAKLIIEESGGMISFDSEEGKGSVFWFLLPVAGSTMRGGGKTLTTHENNT